MNKLITLGVLMALLFLVAPKAYADSKHCDRDGWPAVKPTKTNRLVLRCDNCGMLLFAN
jgi:hypothetical protein